MNEGQGHPGQLEGISLSIIISKNESIDKQNYTKNSKNKQKIEAL